MAGWNNPRPWLRQPQTAVGIAYTPFTRNLISLDIPAHRSQLTAVNAPAYVATLAGLGFQGNGSSSFQYKNIPGVINTGTTPVTLMALVRGTTASTDSRLYGIADASALIFYAGSGLSNAARMRLWYRTPGADIGTLDTTATVFENGTPHIVFMRYAGGVLSAFVDGRADVSQSGSAAGTSGALQVGIGALVRASAGAAYNSSAVILGGVWTRGLADSEIAALSANPWQLFAPLPRRIWAPAAAAGTVALTGVSATGSPGTLASAITQTVIGNAATGSPGALAATTSQALTGAQATGAVGTATASLTVEISGVQATSQAGALVAAISAPLTGYFATGVLGTVANAVSQALQGAAATGQVGIVSADGNVTAALSGVAATGAAGTLASSVALAVTGTQATGSPGSLAALTSWALTGTQATAAAGTAGVTLAVALTGTQAAGQAGATTVQITPAVTGVSAAALPGALGNAVSFALTGNQANGAAGNVIFVGDITLALTGVQATGTAGYLQAIDGNAPAPSVIGGGGGGGVKRRLPSWARQPGKPYEDPTQPLMDRLRADDAAIMAMVQDLYDSGAFAPQAETV